MDRIRIVNLQIEAAHGVHDFEKENPQLFAFDIDLYLPLDKAGTTDRIDDTVNYSQVCAITREFVLGNCFNLIETLAHRLALLLLESYPQVCEVTVEVRKPDAPVKARFDCMAVEVTRRRAL